MWKLKRFIFILNHVIQGDSIKGAKQKWTYYCLDIATLKNFPDTPSNFLPSNAVIHSEIQSNKGFRIKHKGGHNEKF